MRVFSRVGHHQAPAEALKPRTDSFKSLGLKALLQALMEDRKYNTLDLGRASGSNVEFLSRFSSKIRVEDLYETLAAAKFFERGEEPFDESVFGRTLSIPAHERFDIILSWDLVNYLKHEEIRALVRYLESFCAQGTFLFTSCSMLKEIPAVPMTFKILDSETLAYTADSPEMRPCPRHTPRDIGFLMSPLRVHSSFILRNGMQEYVFIHD